MSTKQELRDQRDRARAMVAELVAERNAALDELAAVRAERDNAFAALTKLRQADDPTIPAPRPFRVGDRVRVAEGATWVRYNGTRADSLAAGRAGIVYDTHTDGDLYVELGSGDYAWASPEFCTLIVDDSEVVLPLPEGYTFDAPKPGVTIVLPDGTRVEIPCEPTASMVSAIVAAVVTR